VQCTVVSRREHEFVSRSGVINDTGDGSVDPPLAPVHSRLVGRKTMDIQNESVVARSVTENLMSLVTDPRLQFL